MKNIFKDKYGHWQLWTWFVGGFLALVLVIGALILTIRGVDRHMSQQKCRHWSAAHSQPVKWADYTFWDYDCLTQTPKGRWVSTGDWGSYGN